MMITKSFHPSAQIHPDSVIGAGTNVGANAVIGADVIIGKNCSISAGAVIGADPYVLKKQEGATFPIRISDDVFIGSNVTIQYGITRPTLIGCGSWINHSCAVGHDVHFGEGVMLGLSSTVSGHSNIGDRVRIGPGSTLTNRSEVGADAIIGIGSLVLHPVAAGTTVLGSPAELRADYIKNARRFRELSKNKRSHRKITGGGNRYAKLIHPRLRRLLKKLIGKIKG
jgi:UDP-3-O-[3-hydroxymyristoyl] glucosamine N-acyltransferase